MRTRTRFAILFACIGLAVMAVGVAAIYEALGLDTARRVPAEAEALLGAAARRAVDPSRSPEERLESATSSLIAARALLAEGRVMGKDAVIRLALEVAAILAAVLLAAALAFFLLSRLITRGLDELAAGALAVQRDRTRRFAPSPDPDLDALAVALNELLDLAAEQERRLSEAAKLEGWREVASFLAHQLKNPLAAVLLAAENGGLALDGERLELARESLEIARIEAERLRALIDRFRDLAPAGLGSYGSSREFELRALLEDCAARAERAGASVSLLGPGATVAADRGLVEQAVWNLFANSIEAGSGAPVGIEARIGSGGREASVLILDSNRGLDPEILPRLGRERLSTKAGGTGLGLILVGRILASQGGSLSLSASEGGGLVALATLPLAGASAGAERKVP
jgi:signal transduction histidine kinase